MHPHAELITRFYTAFAAKDSGGMAACYHADVRFSDPVFPDLQGDRARGMWRMLCAQGKDLALEFSGIEAADDGGRAHWEARYTFSAGRKVHNKIDATFKFKDGLIIEHTDAFDLYAWTKMALGPVGFLLGWTSTLQGKIRGQAGAGLDKWMAERAAG